MTWILWQKCNDKNAMTKMQCQNAIYSSIGINHLLTKDRAFTVSFRMSLLITLNELLLLKYSQSSTTKSLTDHYWEWFGTLPSLFVAPVRPRWNPFSALTHLGWNHCMKHVIDATKSNCTIDAIKVICVITANKAICAIDVTNAIRAI